MPAGQGGGTLAGMASTAPAMSKKRRIVVWTLVVLASVLALVSILTTWVNRQMLDNTAWNKATTQVMRGPAGAGVDRRRITIDELYANVNVAQALEQRLPKNLQAARRATRRRPRAARDARRAGSPPAPALPAGLRPGQRGRPREARQRAREQDRPRHPDRQRGRHARPAPAGRPARHRLGLSSSAIAKLPNKAGTITLLKSNQLSAAQAGVQAVHVLSVWLLVAVLFLYGLAIYLARGARRATLRNAGVGLRARGTARPRPPARCSATTSPTRSPARATSRRRTACG